MVVFPATPRQFVLVLNNKGTLNIFEQLAPDEYIQKPATQLKKQDYGYMKLTRDRAKLVVSSLRGHVEVFDMTGFPVISKLRELRTQVYSMFDRSFDLVSGRPVVFSTLNKSDRISVSENWRTHKSNFHLGHSQLIYTTRVGRLAPRFFTGSYDYSVRIWNLHSRKLYQRVQNYHKNWISVIDLACKERLMITTGFDKHVRIYDIARKVRLREIELDTSSLYAMSWVESKQSLLVGGCDRNKMYVIDQIEECRSCE